MKATIDGSLFAVGTSPPSDARAAWVKVFTLFNEGKKGLKGGWIELLPEKGPL